MGEGVAPSGQAVIPDGTASDCEPIRDPAIEIKMGPGSRLRSAGMTISYFGFASAFL